MISKLLNWLHGCKCDLPAKAARNRHRAMGYDARCIRRFVK